MATTLIRNGRIVTAGDDFVGDVLIQGETIAQVAPRIEAEAEQVVDASGLFVLPGGIDVHTHLDMPFGGTVSSDDFRTGHIAAAFGGTTSHIDFAIQGKGQTLRQTVDNWLARAEGKAGIDYGFHAAITDLPDTVMSEIPRLPEYGVQSIKLFMAYKGVLQVDDQTLYRAMMTAGEAGILTCVHAENGDAIDVLIRKLVAEGKLAPYYHGVSRPPQLEAEATGRAAWFSELTGAPLYVVHLTNALALNEVRRARARGAPVMAETCTQYLFFTLDDLGRPDFEGAKFVCSPPMRGQDDHAALWEGLADDSLQAISTDHCPFNFHGQKELGRESFAKIPNGVPGIEDRMMVLWSEGVVGGRLTPQRFVEITATNPARIFGLWGRKGHIAPGFDADLVLLDGQGRHTISATSHHMNIDYNLYEGWTVTGVPATVFLRGQPVVDKGEWLGQTGAGRYLERRAFDRALAPLPKGLGQGSEGASPLR